MANSKASVADAKRAARITALFERIARAQAQRRPITLAPVSILAASGTNNA